MVSKMKKVSLTDRQYMDHTYQCQACIQLRLRPSGLLTSAFSLVPVVPAYRSEWSQLVQRILPEATLRANIAADVWDAESWQQLAALLLQSSNTAASNNTEQLKTPRAFLDRLLSTFPTSVSLALHGQY